MSGSPDANCAVFTVCNLAYLSKALVLAESLTKYDQMNLIIYLIDKKRPIKLPEELATLIWIEDVGVPNMYELAFKYDITEFSTSLKPWLTLRLLESHRKVIFLDPDTCLYHSVGPILSDLDDHSILLTPHYTIPLSDDWPDGDIGMMRFGSFNLGFYAVKRTDQGLAFLDWWSKRCFRLCYFETQFGLSTDQKWASIAPCFFDDLYISFNLGYNVAFWNVQERTLRRDSAGGYVVNDKFPLIFFHFSAFDERNPDILSKRPFRDRSLRRAEVVELSRAYSEVLSAKSAITPAAKYGFDYMSGGEYISPTLRRAYACICEELPANHDPFDSNGAVGAFARKNHLFERRARHYVPSGFGDIAAHKGKFAVINVVMRLILRMIGPNQFTNFARLLVYLSSYRQNRGLWKL